MTKVWRKDIFNCPVNKRVHFLCGLGNSLFEIIGTLTYNPYRGTIVRGQCLEGNEDIFYRGEIIAWATYATDEEVECLYI